MTKLNSHLKKGFIFILSLTLIFSNINVYAIDLDNANIIVEEENLDNETILVQDNEDNSIINETNNEQTNFNQDDITNNSNILDDYNINQEDVSSLINSDIDENFLYENQEDNISLTSLDESNLSIQSDDTITFDVTGLVTGSDAGHTHIYEEKYNDNQHWQECIICKDKKNITNHTLHTTYSLGVESCRWDNPYTITCSGCGYSKTGYKPCHWDGVSYIQSTGSAMTHAKKCSVCSSSGDGRINHCYYNDKTGQYFSDESTNVGSPHNYHVDKNGNILTCEYVNSIGGSAICQKCGAQVTGNHQFTLQDLKDSYSYTSSGNLKSMVREGNIKCTKCGLIAGTLKSTNTLSIINNLTNNHYVIEFTITNTSYKWGSIGTALASDLSGIATSQNGSVSFNNDYTKATVTLDYLNSGIYEEPKNSWSGLVVQSKDGTKNYSGYYHPGNPIPDAISPNVNVVQNNSSGSNIPNITVSGTENISKSVSLQIFDSSKTQLLYTGATNVSNGNYSISLTPNIEGAKNGTTYYIKVIDKCGNSIMKSFIIKNVDNKVPSMTSSTSTTLEWSKSKTFQIKATDVNQVSIALNNLSNYTLANYSNGLYFKNYKFVGDVYGSVKSAIYLKDSFDNMTTKLLTIYNIDNTKPTITKVENSKALGSTSLTITANDINTTLNKSGSGVSKYIITSSNTTPSEDDSNWQDSNVLKVTTPGTYYIFAKDLVGNISNAYEVKNVKVDYTLSVNPNGGSWNNSSSTQDFTITNGDTKTIANPSKVGYTFKNWTLNGTNAKFENSIFTMGNVNASLVANWNINQYNVTYIDVVNSINGKQLGKTTKKVNYNSNVRGSDIGSSTSDNAYYNGYYYSSDTNASVTTNGATVYRIFKLRTIDKTSNLTWNDNNNKNGFRPSKYTLKLMRNGALFKQVELTSYQTSYTFSNLTKYDSKGNAFKYTFEVDASDRYKITLDSNGNTITENYQNSNFSVTIPKIINLNGLTGKGNYNVKVSGIFYYNDTLTVTPSNSFTLKDKNNINSLQANITQNTTSFTKNNLGSTSGSISLNKTKFAGKFNGTFNFNIKFVMKN